MNVLVTGCGSDIGQGIARILRRNAQFAKIVGSDIHSFHPGKFLCHTFVTVPRADDSNYIGAMELVIKDHEIDIVIPCSEPELRFLTWNNINELGGKPLVMSNHKSRVVGFDKMKTVEFLKNHNLPYPGTNLLETTLDFNFPAIIKSRFGSGSSSLQMIENENEFKFFKTKFPDWIIQDWIPSKEGEFTCGLFRSKNNVVRHIEFNRHLGKGYSTYGVTVKNKGITALLEKIAEKLDLMGSINVQLRLFEGKPYVFEINPRFSSTVVFRHLFGFSDLLWSIEDVLEKPLSDFTEVEEGRQFYKGYNEYYE